MTIDIALLVSPITFQDYMVDKDTGAPLSAGVVACYVDTQRNVFKNWYYQTGTPGSYTYVPLSNPLVLSAVGTVTDGSGNDVLPFFYPYDESSTTPGTVKQAYHIEVYSSESVFQFSRDNFPFAGSPTPPQSSNPTFKNYIINNNFWRNIQTYNSSGALTPVSLTSVTQLTVAPSQHDGFQYPDIQFFKSTAGAVDTVSFPTFPLGSNPLQNPSGTGDITPEFYLNHTCTAAGTETYKYYLFPVCYHIKNLDGQPVTVTINVQGGDSNPNNEINLYFLQDWGTQAATPSYTTNFIGTITPSTTWTKYLFQTSTPSASGATLSPVNDDALYLVVALPAGNSSTCNINFALPSLYLGTQAATNDFTTYDQIDAIINSPRTGDNRVSFNLFGDSVATYSYGWIPATGTIGNFASGGSSRANTDAWQLYSVIWNNTLNADIPTSNGGGRGASAYDDFIAGYTLDLSALQQKFMYNVWGLSNVGNLGGASTATLTIANLASHTHGLSTAVTSRQFLTNTTGSAVNTDPTGPTDYNFDDSGLTGDTDSTGSATPFSIIPPYFAVAIYFKL